MFDKVTNPAWIFIGLKIKETGRGLIALLKLASIFSALFIAMFWPSFIIEFSLNIWAHFFAWYYLFLLTAISVFSLLYGLWIAFIKFLQNNWREANRISEERLSCNRRNKCDLI